MSYFSFNGLKYKILRILRGRERPAWAPLNRDIISVPGVPGGYLSKTETDVRIINVPVGIVGKNIGDLQKIKETLAKWLVTDEPRELIFDDEPDRIYYAVVDRTIDFEELVRVGEGLLVFVCVDPYKYKSPPHKIVLDKEKNEISYQGTAPTAPKFEFDVLEPITNLDIYTETEYMRLGEPANIDDTVYDPKTTMMDDDASTTIGWGAGGYNVDDGQVSGTITSDGQTFYASDYGTGGNAWRGPAIIKSFPNAEQLQDFEIKVMLMSRSDNVGGIGRAEAYLLASDMTIIGKLSVSMPSVYTSNLFTRIDVRGATGKQMIFDRSWRNEHYAFVLELQRKGTLYTAKVGQVLDDGTTRHLGSEQFDDLEQKYQLKLASIGLHLGAFSTMPFLQYNRIHHTLVYRLNQPQGVPYIAMPGDKIVLDFKETSIRINGEDRKDLKDRGASYFDLKSGKNIINIAPFNSVSGNISYREAFL